MTDQRTAEWDRIDERALQYHMAQWREPKRSTVAFHDFAAPTLRDAKHVVDLGCGAGAATAYLAERFPESRFTGVDISAELTAIASRIASEKSLRNLEFRSDDWYALGQYPGVDGVISIQSLSWLPDFERPLEAIFTRIAPRWIVMSSLFYDGRISCRIEVEEHARERKTFYNVYSLQVIDDFCARHGYRLTQNAPFELDIDLPRPADPDLMATYTLAASSVPGAPSRRLQVSGPLLLSWRFIKIEKRD